MIYRAYKYPLKPNRPQAETFCRWFGVNRWLYNQCIEVREWYYDVSDGGCLSFIDQCKELTYYRKKYEWVKEVPVAVARGALEAVHRAFSNMEDGAGHPNFKCKYGSKRSFSIIDNLHTVKINRTGKRHFEIKLPAVGWVKYRHTRDLPKNIEFTRITVTQEGGKFFIAIAFKQDVEMQYADGIVGIDRGITNSMATSNGVFYNMPDTKEHERKLKRNQRILSRRDKGSRKQKKNCSGQYMRQKMRTAKNSLKIRNIRNNFIHQTTTEIKRNYGTVVLEDLQVKNMSKSAKGTVDNPGRNVKAKSGLNRGIQHQGWGKTGEVFGYKCRVVKVNPQRTSQKCSKCKVSNPLNRKREKFKCLNPGCGHEAHADVNAAVNILEAGVALTARGGAGLPAPTGGVGLPPLLKREYPCLGDNVT